MTRVALFLATTLIAVTPAAGSAQRVIPNGIVREGTLSFDGRATAGDFTGTTTTITGEMRGGNELSAVRGWVEAPVVALRTGNNRRDRDLNKSMESKEFPTIRFELAGVTASGASGDSVAVTLQGRFIIHGVTREATLPASVVFLPGGLRVRADTPLNLKDYSIGGLSKMLGMLKMYEEIVVHVDLVFGAAPDDRTQTADAGKHS
jgi:polyisoprenoid-binding protein YceI